MKVNTNADPTKLSFNNILVLKIMYVCTYKTEIKNKYVNSFGNI